MADGDTRGVRRHAQRGQAVLEMALVIPICLALITGYLSVMLMVQTQARVEAAVELAAAGAANAPVGDVTNGCHWASASFVATLYGSAPGSAPASSGGHCALTGYVQGAVTIEQFSCPADALLTSPAQYANAVVNNQPAPPIMCSAQVQLDFSATPLGWAVPFRPTFTVSATAEPSNARQCSPLLPPASCQ